MKFISNHIETQRKVATIWLLRDFDTMRVLGLFPSLLQLDLIEEDVKTYNTNS
jgi:hypothetical protein